MAPNAHETRFNNCLTNFNQKPIASLNLMSLIFLPIMKIPENLFYGSPMENSNILI